MEKKIEMCGFCGRYFRGNEYLTTEELNKISKEELDNAPLGYCPEAQQEDFEQNPEHYMHQVTRDMAIDAGQPELEGTWI
jgi:hypothetical protein